MSKDLEKEMEAECRHIHKVIFPHIKCSSELIEAYIRANTLLFNKSNKRKLASVKINIPVIVENNLDIEAIEYYIRITKGMNQVTQKFHIMSYLTEVRRDYYNIYTNEKSQFLKAAISIGWNVIRSIFKLLKGKILVRRYHVV